MDGDPLSVCAPSCSIAAGTAEMEQPSANREALLALADCTRREPLSRLPENLCRAATGREGCLAGSGAALRSADNAAAIVWSETGVMLLQAEPTFVDPVLTTFGLSLGAVPETRDRPCSEAVVALALAVRTGLVERMLDVAHAHLKPRSAFGQKTLTQPLVKVAFSDVYARCVLTRELLAIGGHEAATLAAFHDLLGEAQDEAETLMGGHGFLMGGVNALGHLSLMVLSIYGIAS